MEGCKFRRQQPISRYIVDFVCLEKKLVIEADGGQHAANQAYDTTRDEWLKGEGYRVLRFWDNEVFGNLEGVLETIRNALLGPHSSHLPDPHPTSPTFAGEENKEKTIVGTRETKEMGSCMPHPGPNELGNNFLKEHRSNKEEP